MGDRITGLVAAGILAVLPWSGAAAQDYPAGKAIEMTVLFGAGSAADTTARELAKGMEERLKTAVPVVNRTGGGGALGYTHVSQQAADGYAIVWNSNSISTSYHLGRLPFNYEGFKPVARVSIELPALAIKADSEWKSLKDLVEYAKANPGKVRIGNSGLGSHTHLTAAALFSAAGAEVVHVPFNKGQAITNLLGDRIEAMIQLPAAMVGQVKAGKLRVIASIGSKRAPIFPDVPTAQEQGVDVALDMWRGIAVPKDTPDAVVATLEGAIKGTVESDSFTQAGSKLGFTPAFLTAAEFGKVIAADDKKIGELVAQLGLKKK